MFSRIGNRKKIILSTLFIVLLIWGVQGVSYGQELSVSLSGPSTVQSGGNISFTATVGRSGTGPSTATNLVIYRSTDSTGYGSPDSEFIAVASIPNTQASLSVKISNLTAPSTATERSYYYRAYIIPIIGSDTDANNWSAPVTVTVTAGAPNLTLNSYLQANTSYVAPGQFVTLTAYVSNSGSAASPTFSAYLSYNGRTDASTTPVHTVTRVIPASRTNYQVHIPVTIPSASSIYSRYYYRVQMGHGPKTAANSTGYTTVIVNPVDLSVGTPSADKSTVAPGETFTLSTTVSNVGTGTFTGSTTLRYFQSADTTLNRTDGSDTEVGTDTISSTISGSYGTTSEDITLTAPSEPGTYYYFAYVDPVPGEGYNYYDDYNYYGNIANNTSSYVTVTVSAPPDLTVSLYRPRQATFAPGERFILDATVYNGGTGASAATQLRVYEDSDDSRYRREQQITSRSVSAISAGSSTSVSIPLTAPTDGGVYYYRVSVDTVTGETETGNNASNWIGIDVLEPLVLESLQASKVSLTSGESFTLTATVKNDGNTRSAGTTVQYYRSNDNRLSSSDTRLGSSTVSGIAAGGTTQVSTSLRAPQAPGTYYYGACVGDSQTYSGDACEVIKLSVLVVSVILPESQRPPMYWVDAGQGTLQSLTGSEVDPFIASVRNATAIAIDMAGGKVYWAEQIDEKRSRVRRANLDGRNVQVVKEMGGAVRGIAIDSAKGNLYMTNARANGRGNIQRSKLDGSVFHWNYIDNLSPALSSPRDIALDVAGG